MKKAKQFNTLSILKNRNLRLLSVFCLVVLCSCNSKSSNKESDNSLTSNSLDSSSIEKQILESFMVVDTFYNAELDREDTISFYPAYVATKLKLNRDEYLDYFVIADYMSGPTSGYFYDGKTGEEIKLKESYDLILSRPGVDMEYEIIDVNCGDSMQELLLRTGGGGTIGSYYNLEIYRFDNATNTLKTIFKSAISSLEWEDDLLSEKILEVNYIDINYQKNNCSDTIKLWQGEMLHPENPYSLDILPKKDHEVKIFVFNPLINEFECMP